MKQKTKRIIYDLVYDIIGCALFSAGIYTFIQPANIAPGGLSGITLMINHVVPLLPIGLLMYLFNIPLLILAWFFLGRRMTKKTIITVSINTVMLDLIIPLIVPVYHGDRLLSSVFGGILVGAGLALVFMRGSTTGGTDTLAWLIRLKIPHFSIGKALLAIDSLILLVSIYVYHDLESGLYGMISMFCTTKVIDTIIYGFDKGNMIMVFSPKNPEIAKKIMDDIGRGVTFLEGSGAYSNSKTQVLICAIRKHQYARIKSIIFDIDPNAFVTASEVSEILGEGFKTTN